MHPQCEQPFGLSLLCRTSIGRASSVPEFRHCASKLRHLCLASSLRAAEVLLSGRRGILAPLSDRSARRASSRRAMRRAVRGNAEHGRAGEPPCDGRGEEASPAAVTDTARLPGLAGGLAGLAAEPAKLAGQLQRPLGGRSRLEQRTRRRCIFGGPVGARGRARCAARCDGGEGACCLAAGGAPKTPGQTRLLRR